MKHLSYVLAAVLVLASLVSVQLAAAKVTVSVNGDSNGQYLYAFKGPAGIDQLLKVSQSGGSISTARARAVFHKYKVTIGNEVISAGTAGDPDLTHVRAGSLFFGKAKFVGAKPGQVVNNFKIKYHIDGTVKCFTPDDSVPEGYSLASVETQVRFNNVNRFVGTASVDGVTGFDGGTGDLAGQLDGSDYEASLNKNLTVSLGKVRDGKSYPVLFFGATLVSYAADVPIDYCTADFYDTSDMSVPDDTKQKQGSFVYTAAKPVTTFADPATFSFTTYPDVTVYIEDPDEDFLNAIDVNTVQLFDRLGDDGSIQPWGGILDVGDVDSDGIPDRGLVFKGIDTEHTDLYVLLYNYIFYPQDDLDLYVIGETDAGVPFSSKLIFHTES